jgi:hypothetical protein
MECKNCRRPIKDSQLYCGACGAKVIRNRLSFGILWMDFRERFLNFDTTFLRTLRQMTLNPDDVINGYISGIRKKYMDPITYLGIAITLSGFQVFLIQRYFKEAIRLELWNSDLKSETYGNTMDSAMDFHAFFFVVLIPMFAFCGWIVFNRQQQFFSEHLVGATYILAHYSIVITPFTILVLLVNPAWYGMYSMVGLSVMLLYALYAYRQTSSYTTGPFIFRASIFSLLFSVLYLIFSVAIVILFLVMGVVSMEDFKP